MKRIDLSRSLSYIGDDIIAEAMAIRNMKSASRKPMFARYAAIAASCAAVIFAAVLIGTGFNRDMPVRKPDSGDVTVPSADSDDVSEEVTTEQPDSHQTTVIPDNKAPGDEGLYSETGREEKLPAVGGNYTPLSRKYVDDAYDILPIIRIINDEVKVQEWVDNVLYAQSEDDMLRVPSLYQAVNYFGITKEELYAYNDSLLEISPENPMVLPEYIIEAMYLDETEMMRELANSFALYYDGAVYSYDEIINSSVAAETIPSAVLSEYVLAIEPLLIEYYGSDVYEKEFQASIDEVKKAVAEKMR